MILLRLQGQIILTNNFLYFISTKWRKDINWFYNDLYECFN